jgi:hypothetical protein
MNITAAVMAHPKRKAQAEALASQLKEYPFMEVTLSYDSPDAGSHQSEWDNGCRAMRAGVNKGDWHVVVQDDAILCPLFYENLTGAIQSVPTRSLISLYTGTARPMGKRVLTAVNKAKTSTWLQYWLLMWGVGLLIPSNHIEAMLDFVSDRKEQYDTRIGIFYQRNMLPIYYTMPSLVDHDDELPSLLGHGQTLEPRVAHRMADGLVKWNSSIINI